MHREITRTEYQVLTFPSRLGAILSGDILYSWRGYADWGITDYAFSRVGASQLGYLLAFCQPKALREHPYLTLYYRTISGTSRRAIRLQTGIDLNRYERSLSVDITFDENQVNALARLFNTHIASMIERLPLTPVSQDLGDILRAKVATLVGEFTAISQAEHLVQRLLVKEAVRHQLVQAFIRRGKSEIVPFDEQQADELLSQLETYRGLMLTNKTSILFASEPDMALIARDGATIAVIEVKGGTDPAGALERYGAAKKSFEKTLAVSPNARTIFVANSITSEVRQRLSSDRTVTKFFDLAGILSDSVIAGEFSDYIFGLLESDTE